jgi:hypothetical protein
MNNLNCNLLAFKCLIQGGREFWFGDVPNDRYSSAGCHLTIRLVKNVVSTRKPFAKVLALYEVPIARPLGLGGENGDKSAL